MEFVFCKDCVYCRKVYENMEIFECRATYPELDPRGYAGWPRVCGNAADGCYRGKKKDKEVING